MTPDDAASEPPTGTGDVELSLVVPVFNELGNIPTFIARIEPVLASCTSSFEIIFAADPSTDGTEELLEQRSASDSRIKFIVFSRRFGQPTATLAGIEFTSGRAVIVMDVDLQDPPELVVEMVAQWRAGYDVVYAQRRKRTGETVVKRVVARVGYRLIDRFGEVPIPRDTGDFRLMDRRVVDALMQFPEAHGFLRGLVALVGFRQTAVAFDRPARYSGKGNYNRFFGSIRIGLNGLVAFSSALLNLSTWLGFFAAVGSLLLALGYGLAKIFGASFPVGNPTIVVLVLFLGGMQLICLGLAGQYIGRIYDEVKRRPRYLIDRAEGFATNAASPGRLVRGERTGSRARTPLASDSSRDDG